jgi:D-tyrosyl-tRNA(Tyr) deacylase
MRLVLQRVKRASVEIDGRINGAIEGGLLIFAGFTDTDTAELIPTAVSKVIQMRIFADQAGKLNLSLLDTGGSILIISQFYPLCQLQPRTQARFYPRCRSD